MPAELDGESVAALAAALHASYARDEERWRLRRLAPSVDALRREDVSFIKGRINRLGARVRGVVTKHGGSHEKAIFETLREERARFATRHRDALDTSSLQAQEASPCAYLLADLLQTASPVSLAAATPGAVTVLSNDPKGGERPLEGWRAPLARYLRSQAAFAEWASHERESGRIEERDRWLLPKHDYLSGAKTLQLTVDRRGPEPAFALAAFDARGRMESSALLTAEGFAPPVETDRPRRLGKVPLPAEAVAAMGAIVPGRPAFRVGLLDPVACEPLDLFVRDALLAYGRAKGSARIVACVSDDLYTLAEACVDEGGAIDLDRFSNSILKAGCEEMLVGKVLVVRPRLALQEEALRVDRSPLSSAFRSAAKGAFGLRELCSYHLAYVSDYANRPFLARLERPIREAFELDNSPNWTLPHSVLAALGSLTPTEWRVLFNRSAVPLAGANRASLQSSLAEFASGRMAGQGNELALTPTRLVAVPSCASLRGDAAERTLIRRIVQGYSERTIIEPTTQEARSEKGKGLFLDDVYVPPDVLLDDIRGPLDNDSYRKIQDRYLFLWVQERTLALRISFGGLPGVGPLSIRERIGQSRNPVSLDRVPGLNLPRAK